MPATNQLDHLSVRALFELVDQLVDLVVFLVHLFEVAVALPAQAGDQHLRKEVLVEEAEAIE